MSKADTKRQNVKQEQAEESLKELLRFERLVSDLSARFVNIPPGQVDPEINRALKQLLDFFHADRCSIGLFSEDGSQLALAFEYRSAKAKPAPESMSKEQMPWYLEQLTQGKPVVMNRVEDLPPEAEKERQLCLVKGMKSLLSIPMVSGGRTLGSCALVSTRAERVWPDELLQRFRLVTEVFVNVLQRRRIETMLQTSEEKFRQFFKNIPDYCYIVSTEGNLLHINEAAPELRLRIGDNRATQAKNRPQSRLLGGTGTPPEMKQKNLGSRPREALYMTL